jgi:Tat protein secretion system quality control protein TatD with DNase activity
VPEAADADAALQAIVELLLLETDAPDLTPPDLPRPNEPAALLAVARAMASLRGASAQDLLARSAAACAELFGDFTLRAETRPPAGVSSSCPS